MIPALEEGVATMAEGGVRQLIVPPAIGYPKGDPEHDKVVGEGFYGAMNSLKRNCACGKKGEDAPLKKSTIDDDGVTVETGLRSPSPGPSASTKVKVTPGIDETDL